MLRAYLRDPVVTLRRLSATVLAAFVGAFLVALPAQGASVTTVIDGIMYQADDANIAAGATIVSSGDVAPDLVIPETVNIGGNDYAVTQVANYAFQSKNLDSVHLPSTLRYIQPSAFSNNYLNTITVPGSVGLINTGAFAYNNLTSVNLEHGTYQLAGGVFAYNQLTSVTIPASVTGISGSAFLGNPLGEVTFLGDAPVMGTPNALGTSGPVVKYHHDVAGFSSPTWTAGGVVYTSELIPAVTVTFDANGHGTSPMPSTGRPGHSVDAPAAPTASGYTVNGWYTAASGGAQVAFPYIVTSDTTRPQATPSR